MKSKILALSKNEEFKNLLKQKKITNKYVSIFFGKLLNKDKKRLNISFVTKKKIGNAVKRNKIKRRLRNIMNEAVKEVYCFGHLGDGNVHVNIVSDTNLEGLKNKIYELTISVNGSPSAEHGIGQRKKHIWADFSYYSDKLKLLESLKKSMDPNNILCPKVFFD